MRPRKASAESRLMIDEPVVIDTESSPPPHAPDDYQIATDEIEPWFELSIGEHPVRFGFVSEAEICRANGGEDDAHALTWAERGIVVFDQALKKNRPALAVLLLHELVHVGLGASYGSHPIVARLLGARTETQHAEREEGLAAYLSDKLAPALVASGLLKLPRVPR